VCAQRARLINTSRAVREGLKKKSRRAADVSPYNILSLHMQTLSGARNAFKSLLAGDFVNGGE
jgi:hypothetical protein